MLLTAEPTLKHNTYLPPGLSLLGSLAKQGGRIGPLEVNQYTIPGYISGQAQLQLGIIYYFKHDKPGLGG